MNRVYRSVTALACLGLSLSIMPQADACCAAPRPGQQVRIADQKILVIWDAEKGIEHFIRRADFLGNSKDFGFFVPTPSTPELAESDNAVFERLEETTKPVIKTVIHRHYKLQSILTSLKGAVPTKAAAMREAKSMGANSVRVLQKVKVAGYDAVTLGATNLDALAKWLKDNKYEINDDIKEWLKPYVEQQWKITAFKYDPKQKGMGRAKTSSVRMSFKTKRPLFPYRVPKEQLAAERDSYTRQEHKMHEEMMRHAIQKNPEREAELRTKFERWLTVSQMPKSVLRVFFVGPKRVVGKFDKAKQAWPGKLRYAKSHSDIAEILGDCGPKDILPQSAWLTSFDDPTWPGGVDDLYFKDDAKQEDFVTVKIRHEDVDIVIPLELLGLGLVALGGVGAFMFLREKKAK